MANGQDKDDPFANFYKQESQDVAVAPVDQEAVQSIEGLGRQRFLPPAERAGTTDANDPFAALYKDQREPGTLPPRVPTEQKGAIGQFLDETFGEGELGGTAGLGLGWANLVNRAESVFAGVERIFTFDDLSENAQKALAYGNPIAFGGAAQPGLAAAYVKNWIRDYSKSFHPTPPTGVLSRPAEDLQERLDPRRLLQVVTTQGPSSLVEMGLTYLAPPVGMAYMGLAENESLQQTFDRIEEVSGKKVSMQDRIIYGAAIGTAVPYLEKLGFDRWSKTARASGLTGKLIALAVTAATEGATETGQEGLHLVAEEMAADGVDLDYWNIPDDIETRLAEAAYGGVVLGGVFGVAGDALSRVPFSNKTQGQASVFSIESQEDGVIRPLFRIDIQGHELFGQAVDAQTLLDNGIEVPVHREQLLRAQLEQAGMTYAQIDAQVKLADRFARVNGMSLERMLKVTGISIQPGESVEADLFQKNTVGPIWASRMGAVVPILDGLPKQAPAREYLARLEGEVNRGKFSRAELEWSGMKDFLDGDEVISREEVIEFAQNHGLMLDELVAAAPSTGLGEHVTNIARANIRESLNEGDIRAVQEISGGVTDIQYLADALIAAEHDSDVLQRLYQLGINSTALSNVWLIQGGVSNRLVTRDFERLAGFLSKSIDESRANNQPAPALTALFSGTTSQEILAEVEGAQRDGELSFLPESEQAELLSIVGRIEDVSADTHTARYQRYALPGGDKYREYAVILPFTGRYTGKDSRVERLIQIEAEILKQRRTTGQSLNELEGERLRYVQKELDHLNTVQPLSPFPSNRGHFPADNVLGHIRLDVRVVDGEKVIFVHELQSDWAQQGREHGVQDPEQVTETTRSVPQSPYLRTDKWVQLLLRRTSRIAADMGIATLVFNNGDTAQQYTFGELEGQRTFYDEIVPNNIAKVFKGSQIDKAQIGINPRTQAGDGGNFFGDISEQRDFVRVRMTEEQMGDALGGVILPQTKRTRTGEVTKGYTQFVKDGETIIGLFKSADVSTVMHELFHVFRRYMNPDLLVQLEKNYGIEDGVWTTLHEERFAREAEAWLASGETTNKVIQPILKRFKEWMLDAYVIIVGSEIDIDVAPEMKKFFADMFDSPDIFGDPSSIKSRSKWMNKILDFLDVEHSFRQAGAPKTGFHIKNAYTEVNRHVEDGARVYRGLKRLLKTDAAIVDALLVYESVELSSAVTDPNLKKALAIIDQYFDQSLTEYKMLGGLEKGFIEQAKANLENTLSADFSDMFSVSADGIRLNKSELTKLKEAAAKGDASAVAKLTKLRKAFEIFDKLEGTRFVHIPMALFQDYLENKPNIAINILKVLADIDRKTIRLADLIESGAVKKEDIKATDIFASYSHRKGKDISLLKIREAGRSEGMIRDAGETSNMETVWDIPKHPIFKGMLVSGPIQEWLKVVTERRGAFSFIQRTLVAGKVLAFYNPLILSSYNMIQLAMGGGAMTFAPKYWVRAFNAMYRDPFSAHTKALMEAGMGSQPFSLPFSSVKEAFERIAKGRGVGFDALVSLAFGATAGTLAATVGLPILGPLGVGTSVLVGLGIPATKPIRSLKEALRGEGKHGSVFKDLARMPRTMIKNLYTLSWDVAWTFDLFNRFTLTEYYLDQGLTIQEAVDRANKLFGDYASVPTNSRKVMNTFLFTPTYKIAMAKMFTDALGGWGQLIAGKGNVDAKQAAKVLMNATAIVIAYDIMMHSLGWDRDDFGRRYTKEVTVNNEDAVIQGEKREIAVTWGGPHDLFYKLGLRAKNAWTTPTEPSGISKFIIDNRWELHPFIRVMWDVVANEDNRTGEPIRKFAATPMQNSVYVGRYVAENIIGILGAVSGENMSPEGIRLFRQEYGQLMQMMTATVTFQFARDLPEQRAAKMMERAYAEFNKSFPTVSDLHRITQKEYEERLSDPNVQRAQKELVRRLNQIELELDEDKYGMPGIYHDEHGAVVPFR